MITVAADGSGDFSSIQKAINSIDKTPETIFIKNGIYKERVEIKKDHLRLIGESSEKTIISNDYYAYDTMPDGSKRGTFRSYTCFVFADDVSISNLTIENTAGFGKTYGQTIALYAEGDALVFKKLRILSHQDSLFTGPLPFEEMQAGGFVGPTEFAPRIILHQYYEDCYIEGEVDFIFGSATAFFKNCTLFALDRNESPYNAYYTAPSTYKNQKYGYVFDSCKLTGNCPEGTAVLSRPWREDAKAVFINCQMDACVAKEGFVDWNKPNARDKVFMLNMDLMAMELI